MTEKWIDDGVSHVTRLYEEPECVSWEKRDADEPYPVIPEECVHEIIVGAGTPLE